MSTKKRTQKFCDPRVWAFHLNMKQGDPHDYSNKIYMDGTQIHFSK